jgi:Ca2+-binding EF-hand superfamily protein
MAEYLNDAKIREYAELFANFDYYSLGFISSKSVQEVLISMQLRVTHEDVIQLIKETGNQSEGYDQVVLS